MQGLRPPRCWNFSATRRRIVTTLNNKDLTEAKEHPAGMLPGDDALLEVYRKLRPGEPPYAGSRRSSTWFRCSLTTTATTSPGSAGISTTKSSPSPPALWAIPWPSRLSTTADRRNHRRRRGEADPRPGDRSWRRRASTPFISASTTTRIIKVISNGMVEITDFIPDLDKKECEINEKVRYQDPHARLDG